jgi:hypothetical protein
MHANSGLVKSAGILAVSWFGGDFWERRRPGGCRLDIQLKDCTRSKESAE